jgi:two-component system CheB/CheR fusion protein
MNEELQSTNEELRTINEHLQFRTEEAHASQSHLEAILEGMRAAVLVLDRDFRVEKMRELWGLQEEEVRGKSLFELEIGLPVKELRAPIEACLRGDAEVPELELDAVNRRGAHIRCGVTCTPLRGEGPVTGVIVLIQRTDDAEDPPGSGPRARARWGRAR